MRKLLAADMLMSLSTREKAREGSGAAGRTSVRMSAGMAVEEKGARRRVDC